MQGFQFDSNNNLAVAAGSSDLSLVSNLVTNLALFWTTNSASWTWAKQIQPGSNLTLVNLQLGGSNNDRMALLYDTPLIVVLNTATGSLVEAHT